eukprot:NODE_4475_length_1887_cov_2.097159.p1 GENE.NODE_4475_length_1887_cov_2.097159~~NODE_4475_length_1887_cov_2.097159.p1  ORF type:complete len:538 (+),score=106.60 NODE_4475_length_1887_cov_2.097159:98-1615(+)
MEVSVLQAQGFEKDCVVSMSAGPDCLRTPLDGSGMLSFPTLPVNASPLRIEVLMPVANSVVALHPASEVYSVLFRSKGASKRTMTLRVKEEPRALNSSGTGFGLGPVSADCEPAKGKDLDNDALAKNAAATVARAYLDRHGLLTLVQEMLQYIIRARPDEPLVVMANFLRRLSRQHQATKSAPSGEPKTQTVQDSVDLPSGNATGLHCDCWAVGPGRPSSRLRRSLHAGNKSSIRRGFSGPGCRSTGGTRGLPPSVAEFATVTLPPCPVESSRRGGIDFAHHGRGSAVAPRIGSNAMSHTAFDTAQQPEPKISREDAAAIVSRAATQSKAVLPTGGESNIAGTGSVGAPSAMRVISPSEAVTATFLDAAQSVDEWDASYGGGDLDDESKREGFHDSSQFVAAQLVASLRPDLMLELRVKNASVVSATRDSAPTQRGEAPKQPSLREETHPRSDRPCHTPNFREGLRALHGGLLAAAAAPSGASSVPTTPMPSNMHEMSFGILPGV